MRRGLRLSFGRAAAGRSRGAAGAGPTRSAATAGARSGPRRAEPARRRQRRAPHPTHAAPDLHPDLAMPTAGGPAQAEAASASLPGFAFARTETHDADDAAQRLRAWDQEYRQLAPGRFEGLTTDLWFDSIQIFRERSNRRVYQAGRPRTGAVTFGILLAMEGAARFCGQTLDLDSMLVLGSCGDLDLLTSPTLDIVGISIPHAMLAALGASPVALDADDRRAPNRLVRMKPPVGERVRAFALRCDRGGPRPAGHHRRARADPRRRDRRPGGGDAGRGRAAHARRAPRQPARDRAARDRLRHHAHRRADLRRAAVRRDRRVAAQPAVRVRTHPGNVAGRIPAGRAAAWRAPRAEVHPAQRRVDPGHRGALGLLASRPFLHPLPATVRRSPVGNASARLTGLARSRFLDPG